ncbi:uncharacterized protein LOC124896575 [Capsicum annuum]|uniref:uncharacterized protein LOC124896575 n=1 Tax=Capsicum annuum TaxID=4072 RepID=UPI001FB08EC1|nr:uncharacterized protein LOC124896575 [Capsicum annuum]
MPGYAKFKKDLITKKRVVSYGLVDNLHHYSAISTRSLVQKKADLREFTIPCTIGSLEFAQALCDLGASINLMPLAIYKKLGLGNSTPTIMRLVMADRLNDKVEVLIEEKLAIEPLAVVLMNFDCEGIKEYEEIVYALSGMGSYSYDPKNLDLDLANRTTPPAKPSIEEPLYWN